MHGRGCCGLATTNIGSETPHHQNGATLIAVLNNCLARHYIHRYQSSHVHHLLFLCNNEDSNKTKKNCQNHPKKVVDFLSMSTRPCKYMAGINQMSSEFRVAFTNCFIYAQMKCSFNCNVFSTDLLFQCCVKRHC